MDTNKPENVFKKILKIIGIIIGLIVAFVVLFFLFISITEFKPDDRIDLECKGSEEEFEGTGFGVLTLNMGYAGLGEEMDFFMDGGKGVNPESKEKVEENLNGIESMLDLFDPDFYFLQEIDKNSSRSYRIDETEYLKKEYPTRVYAQNFVCKWVPYPLPMIGKVDSGVMTLSKYKVSEALRISLPNNTSWPTSMFMLKRCMCVTRVPVKNSDKEIVLVNFHLEAYDDDETKEAQTKVVVDFLKSEYEKGNYVLAGGDFNQTFPGMEEAFPYIEGDELWRPGKLTNSMIPEGWTYAFDPSTPTCRSLDKAFEGLDGHQLYALDGFILSPNLKVEFITAVNCNFRYTDHNPVYIRVNMQ